VSTIFFWVSGVCGGAPGLVGKQKIHNLSNKTPHLRDFCWKAEVSEVFLESRSFRNTPRASEKILKTFARLF
jgi:hypothetical protein